MMDVTVKTLDGQNKNYSLPENITVKEFKDRIANSIGIAADTQRLIFHGRVMQDDKLLKDYDVHGKVIHVVHRPPPSCRTHTETPPSRGNSGVHMNNVVVGSFTLPSDILDPNHVQNIVQQAVSDMGEDWRNARVSARSSNDGSSIDVHINLGQVPSNPVLDSEGQMQLNRARQMMGLAREAVFRLENPPGSQQNGQAGTTTTTTTTTTEYVELNQESDATSPSATDHSGSVEGSQNINSASPSITPMETSPLRSDSSNSDGSQDEPVVTSSDRRDPRSNGPSDSRTDTSSSSASIGTGQDDANRLNRPPFTSLADYIEEAESLNNRLRPFLNQLRDVARRDPQLEGDEVQQNQRLFNLVSEALHAIGHSYHSASDLIVNISEQPPRYMTANPLVHPMARPGPPLMSQVSVGAPTIIQIPPTLSTSTTQTNNANTSASTTRASASTSANANTTAASTTAAATTASITTSSSTSQFNDMTNVTASTSPYVFVEVGPEAITVNSISAHVIATHRPTAEEASPSTASASSSQTSAAPPPTTQPTPTATSSAQPSPTPPTQPPPPQPPQSVHLPNFMGNQNLPTLQHITRLPDMMENIISSVLQTHGHRPGQPVQVNVVPIPVPASRAGSLPGSVSISRVINTGAVPQQASAATQTGTPVTATTTASTSAAFTASPIPPGAQATAGATPASATSTPSQNNAHPRPMFVGPGVIPGDAFPGFIPGMRSHVDPFLPCFSRHFLTQRTRNLAQNNQNPEHMLADMVGNLMAGIIGHGIPTTGAESRSTAASNTASTTTTTTTGARVPPSRGSSGATTHTTSSQPRPISANPFASLLFGTFGPMAGGMPGGTAGGSGSQSTGTPSSGTGRQEQQQQQQPQQPQQANILQMMMQALLPSGINVTTASTQSATTTTTTSTSTPTSTASRSSSTTPPTTASPNASGQARQTVMSEEFFAQLVGGIGRYVGQAASGQEPNVTIAQFLSSFGDRYNVQPEQGFLNDIFNCLSQHMTFSDMFAVFFGHPSSLNHLQEPLQDFVRHRCLQDMEPTEENYNKATDALVDEINSEFEEAVATVEVKPDIDLVASLRQLFRQNLLNLQKLIMEAGAGDDNFGSRLYSATRRLLGEFVILTSSCLVGGMPAFETMMQSRLREKTAGMNPMIQQWMVSMTSQQIQCFVGNITVTEPDVRHYVVHRSRRPARESPMETSPPAPKTEAAAASSTATSAAGATAAASKKTNGPERPKLHNITQSSVQSERVKRPYMNGATSDGQSPSHSESPMSPDLENDSWQSVVPVDWVPVINGDISRQKESTPQAPLSDAYLQGMPPKRRKMMTADRPSNSLTNMSQYIPESVRRAATAAGVQPISSLENLAHEASEESDLHDAFEDEIHRVIFERLQNDSDYDSTRFPNAGAYYQKKGNKK